MEESTQKNDSDSAIRLPNAVSDNSSDSRGTRFAFKEVGPSWGAGLVGGAMGVIIGHPFDSLKTRLQAGSLYKGMKGTSRLYAGITAPLFTAGTIQSLNFSLYEWSKKEILNKEKNPLLYKYMGQSYLQSVFWSGSFAGGFISLVTTPISFIKVRQQLLATESTWEIFKTNPRSFYRAYGCMFWMESFGRGVYLHAYETAKITLGDALHKFQENSVKGNDDLQTHQKQESKVDGHDFIIRAISASWAGCFSWFVVFPLDVIKTRLQLDFRGSQYRGTIDCAKIMYAREGFPVFFRGLTFTMIRAAPVATSVLLTYDYTKQYLTKIL